MEKLRSSTEDKQQIMLERARALKEKRLREKRMIVEEKLLQQQRDACDDARVADTLKKDREIFELRKAQLAEREAREREEKEYERRMAKQWMESKNIKDLQETENEKKLRQRNQEMREMLDQQVSYRNKRKNDVLSEKEKEVQQLKAMWSDEERRAQEKEELQRKQALDRAADVMRENAIQLEQFKQKSQAQLDNDLKLLNMALRKESEQEKAEQDLKDAQKREVQEYQALLRQQMIVEAEDTSNVENLLRQEELRIQARDDAKLAREKAARDHLRSEVIRTRQEQTEFKTNQKNEEKKLDMLEANRLKDQLDQLSIEEQKNSMMSAVERKKYQEEIKAQMDKKQRDADFAKQQAFLEHKHALNAQRNYEDRLKKLVDMPAQQKFMRKTAVWQFDS